MKTVVGAGPLLMGASVVDGSTVGSVWSWSGSGSRTGIGIGIGIGIGPGTFSAVSSFVRFHQPRPGMWEWDVVLCCLGPCLVIVLGAGIAGTLVPTRGSALV